MAASIGQPRCKHRSWRAWAGQRTVRAAACVPRPGTPHLASQQCSRQAAHEPATLRSPRCCQTLRSPGVHKGEQASGQQVIIGFRGRSFAVHVGVAAAGRVPQQLVVQLRHWFGRRGNDKEEARSAGFCVPRQLVVQLRGGEERQRQRQEANAGVSRLASGTPHRAERQQPPARQPCLQSKPAELAISKLKSSAPRAASRCAVTSRMRSRTGRSSTACT